MAHHFLLGRFYFGCSGIDSLMKLLQVSQPILRFLYFFALLLELLDSGVDLPNQVVETFSLSSRPICYFPLLLYGVGLLAHVVGQGAQGVELLFYTAGTLLNLLEFARGHFQLDDPG